MPNPSAQYKIRFNGQVLPGYVQGEDLPVSGRNSLVEMMNRDGGTNRTGGSGFRDLRLRFRVLTRLGNGLPGQLHLADVLEQYREALRIITRVESGTTLFLGDTAHWLVGWYDSVSAPLSAPDNKRISYDVNFKVKPWFYGPEISQTKAISGNDTIVLNMTDTRKTYPAFEIPTGITGITIAHTPSGKTFTLSGAHSNPVIVDCAALTVKDTTGANMMSMLTTGPDFGIYHVGSGSFTANITGVTGSGNVRAYMNPRLER